MKQGDFTKVAKHYHNRPAYSEMLLEKLVRCINDENKATKDLKVVEVGAGTGKLTRMLWDFGMQVLAVEPNDNMREEGIKYTKETNIKWQKGSGEATGVESNFADWVIMASSFHWTDPKKSLPEFARILKTGMGGGGLPELTLVSSGSQNAKKWEDILISTGHFKDCFFMECDYVEVMDKNRYIGAWKSVNDIQAQAGEKRWNQILSMIEKKIDVFDKIEIPYKIRAWSVRKV